MARELLDDQIHIAFAYALGGGVWRSNGFESIGPAGPYGTFGPELSFGPRTRARSAPVVRAGEVDARRRGRALARRAAC